jgi:hypothetical protein
MSKKKEQQVPPWALVAGGAVAVFLLSSVGTEPRRPQPQPWSVAPPDPRHRRRRPRPPTEETDETLETPEEFQSTQPKPAGYHGWLLIRWRPQDVPPEVVKAGAADQLTPAAAKAIREKWQGCQYIRNASELVKIMAKTKSWYPGQQIPSNRVSIGVVVDHIGDLEVEHGKKLRGEHHEMISALAARNGHGLFRLFHAPTFAVPGFTNRGQAN